MSRTRKIAYTGVGIALYVVLSMVAKIPVISHISLDLGYIAFAVMLYYLGTFYGTIVGAAGCVIVSLITTGWFPIGWCLGNIAVGVFCGAMINRENSLSAAIENAAVCVVASAVGIMAIKTGVECMLYSIPVAVKLPRNGIAFIMDAIVMSLGFVFAQRAPIARFFAEVQR